MSIFRTLSPLIRALPMAGRRAGCWMCSISAALLLLTIATMTRAQEEAVAPGTDSVEYVSDPDGPVETMEVLGKRQAMWKSTQAFVDSVTRTDGETLARWRKAICPAVSGLSSEQGEFVRLRILDVAALAGARLDRKEKCRSNLFVVLTPQPDDVLAKWKASNARFPSDPAEQTDGTQEPMPVRIWHNAMLNNADGSPPIEQVNQYRLKDSRIASSVAEDISTVIVLVDTKATEAMTLGQLADYVAMVSLARIAPRADLATTSTILRLFAPSGLDTAPAGLTDWDHAFLKGLYKTYDPVLRQRASIASSMARDLVP